MRSFSVSRCSCQQQTAERVQTGHGHVDSDKALEGIFKTGNCHIVGISCMPTYMRIHPSSATCFVSAMASRFGSGLWGVSQICGTGGAVQPINFTRLVTPSARHSHSWILLTVRWKLKSLFLAPSQQAHLGDLLVTKTRAMVRWGHWP